MSTKPLISLVTPSFNQAKYIGTTLTSVYDAVLQLKDGSFLEYIIMDGGSTDKTKEIILQWEPKFKKAGVDFTYISEPDNGQADAIQKGWHKSHGVLLAFLNSDDTYLPNVFVSVLDYFKNHPNQLWAYGGWQIINDNGLVYKIIQPQKFDQQKLLNYCNIGQPSCFFRTEILDKCNSGLSLTKHYAFDYDLWLQFSKVQPAGIIPTVLSSMRYYAETKSGSKTYQQSKEIYLTASQYSRPYSLLRLRQFYYYLRGCLVIFLGKDITRRVISWSKSYTSNSL
jgi:glycosyltransferase involved in cell wall biosynthesis